VLGYYQSSLTGLLKQILKYPSPYKPGLSLLELLKTASSNLLHAMLRLFAIIKGSAGRKRVFSTVRAKAFAPLRPVLPGANLANALSFPDI
jgi:hypothetical protein